MANKTYYSRVQGSTYYAQDGTAHQFLGNPAYIETADVQLQTELDALVTSSKGIQIFSDPVSAPDMTAQIDAMNAATRAALVGVAVAKVG
jgi:NADPH-dependent curcumin reductase CurA